MRIGVFYGVLVILIWGLLCYACPEFRICSIFYEDESKFYIEE